MPSIVVARAVAIAGAWIGVSEFVRNELLLAGVWDAHYASLGLTFPREPVHAAVWIIWSFVFAGLLYGLSRRFSWLATAGLGWIAAFVMMWLVTWNLSVLPLSILPVALPLSLLESGVAAWLVHRLAPRRSGH